MTLRHLLRHSQLHLLLLCIVPVTMKAEALLLPGRAQLIEAVTYKETPCGPMVVDIFRPDSLSLEAHPVMVFIHGGSWMHLDRTTIRSEFRKQMLDLRLSNGYAVVSVEYRLVNENNDVSYPDPLSDCKDAVRWIRKEAKRYGFAPERIAIGGCSAGAHLSLMTAYTADNMTPGDKTLAPYSAHVNCCIDIYGPTHLGKILHPSLHGPAIWAAKAVMNKHVMSIRETLLTAFTGETKHHPWRRRTKCKTYSPVEYAATAVPTLMLHGNKDKLVSHKQSVRLEKKLQKHHKAYELQTLEGEGHGFPFLSREQGEALAHTMLNFLNAYNHP